MSQAFGTGSTYAYPGNLIEVGSLPGCLGSLRGPLCLYDRYQRLEAAMKVAVENAMRCRPANFRSR